MTLDADNQLIFDFIQHTNQPIFLTGKAGTGKTTFLHYIKKNVAKAHAIVAPTAVAAINAGGVTLHSFFQIPFGPLIPGSFFKSADTGERVNFSNDKIKLLQCLELLIIDEISMVRADVLDYIDVVLRKVKASARPFGGVQVLMIGDLYQLPPVANQDWHLLQRYYNSPYFFDSIVFKSFQVITFELTKVYRQSDPTFVAILNGIRNDQLEEHLLHKLNERCEPEETTGWKEDYITLTTHNKLVAELNQQQLHAIDSPLHTFAAVITGDFPKDGYPTEENLQLKVGAQVMFSKNDSSGKKLYYNGRTAKIKAIDNDHLQVQFLDDQTILDIVPEVWQNVKYNLDHNEQTITETNAGSFTQYPVKLAWSITIHKSQGLTFDKAIVDISSAFAHGQAYVALSRCRSLEGLILKAPLKQENIITDLRVINFMKSANLVIRGQQALHDAKALYNRGIVDDLMDFTVIAKDWALLGKLLLKDPAAQDIMSEKYKIIHQSLYTELINIADKFVKTEIDKLADPVHVLNNPAFVMRLEKAGSYFIPKVEKTIQQLEELFLVPWNPSMASEVVTNLMNDLILSLLTKATVFRQNWQSFKIEDCIAAVHSVQVDYLPMQKGSRKVEAEKEKEIENPKLYESLMQWRTEISKKRDVPDHTVLSEKVLKVIAAKLPKSTEELSAISGVGRGNAVDYGPQIIKLVNNFRGVTELF
ncbi:HRDC domain-containing protein [Pedobacter sp. MC2016-14]|uniref:HRDC domain-containing protein n=1 Tax=Pedobacter sp. MC2016-14 TaxID=2897327 RepID=UPI0021045AFE|nr:HRDC domain-containing protein [Pedobacter sp. MC2016-14]